MRCVRFMSRHEVQKYAASPGTALISIYDRSEPPLEFDYPWGAVLHLRFHDGQPDILGLELFDVRHAQLVLEFAHRHAVPAPELVVHCHGGVSRSAAIALFLASRYEVPCIKDGEFKTLENWNRYNRHVLHTLCEVADGSPAHR